MIRPVLCLPFILLAQCQAGGGKTERLRDYPVADRGGVAGDESVVFDPLVSRDGNGSLRVTAADTTLYLLYEVAALEIDDAVLSYEADLKSEDLEGQAYLEMHVRIPGKGEYRALNRKTPMVGPSDWIRAKAGYLFAQGESPDRVRLHLWVAGRGTVWIDRLALLREPRP